MITLGNNVTTPEIYMGLTQDIYALIKSAAFDCAEFNSLLAAALTYADVHGMRIDDGLLPWAEDIQSEKQ